jgi:glycine/D-amino acid oxidase-like deaminating enzyme
MVSDHRAPYSGLPSLPSTPETMSPPVDPVVSDATLPARTGVVVIGGGIIGTCTALFLAEKGHAVVLCEKGRIGAEQSSRNWGWCRTMGRHEAEIPLAIESLRLWQGMNKRVGRDTGFRQAGIIYLCETEKEIARHAAWLDKARQYQVDARLLRGLAVDDVIPGASGMFIAGMHTPTDGRAEPSRAAPAIAEAARAKGVAILTDCAVRGLDTKAGRVAGVVTEKGSIACEAVVLAGGAWSRLFCGNASIALPQLRVLASAFRTAPISGGPETAASGSIYAFRKRLDGGYTIARRNANIADITPDSFRLLLQYLPTLKENYGEVRVRFGRRFFKALRSPKRWSLDQVTPFEETRVLDPAPKHATLEEARRTLARGFAAFANMRIVQSWGGMIDVTPDTVPVIGSVDTVPGFYLATGFSGHGFGIGPGAGRLMADIVTGDPPVVDPKPFQIARFAR